MTTAIIEAPSAAVVNAAPANSPVGMMLAALQQGASLDQFSQMMDLQERWNKQEAKKAYDAAFAAFKAESVTIIKGKARSNGPLEGQKYAELHDVVNAVTPALSKHGLSSSWKLTKDDKDWMEVTCFLRHVGGHEESVSMGGPPDAGSARNAIQARASTKTYLERYTLKAITGLAEQGDDTDGSSGSALDDWLAKVDEAASEDELRATMRAGVKVFQAARDQDGYKKFAAAVKKRGAEIKQPQGDSNA